MWASSVGLCQRETITSPSREDEPAGTRVTVSELVGALSPVNHRGLHQTGHCPQTVAFEEKGRTEACSTLDPSDGQPSSALQQGQASWLSLIIFISIKKKKEREKERRKRDK